MTWKNLKNQGIKNLPEVEDGVNTWEAEGEGAGCNEIVRV
jgi:hypothetical protein